MTTNLDRARAVLDHADAHGLGDSLLGIRFYHQATAQLFVRNGRYISTFTQWARTLTDAVITASDSETIHLHAKGSMDSGVVCRVTAVLDEPESDLVAATFRLDGPIPLDRLASLVEGAEVTQ